jgi:hypothetical protein
MKRYIVYIIAVLWVMAFVWQSIAHADPYERVALRHRCHLLQSSSASRLTAGAYEFFILSRSAERPDR